MWRHLVIALLAVPWSAALCAADQMREPDPWGESPAAKQAPAAAIPEVKPPPAVPQDRPTPADRGPAAAPRAPVAEPEPRAPAPAAAKVPPPSAPLPPEEPDEPVALPEGQYRTLLTAYGTQFDVYVVGPESAAHGALLVHDQWGFTEPLRVSANRMAALGFRVVALDLYGGHAVRGDGAAREAWRSVDPVIAQVKLKTALAELERRQSRVVAVGWGAGMRHAAWIAGEAPRTVTALITYRDAAWAGVEIRGPRNVAALNISTERSLGDPGAGERAGEARREAWQATQRFLGKHFPE